MSRVSPAAAAAAAVAAAAAAGGLPLSPDSSSKRKRHTSAPIASSDDADAGRMKEAAAAERVATPSPLPAAVTAAAASSTADSERLAKLSRVEGGARSDVSSGSPVVLVGSDDSGGFSDQRSKTDGSAAHSYSAHPTPRASPPLGIHVASASTSPRIGSTGSTPQGLPPHASGGGVTVLAALSARTPASSLSLSVSAASSNLSTPAGGYSLRASALHASALTSPTWSPMASSANTPHQRGTPFHASDAALAQEAAAAYHAAAASSSAVQPLSVPMTPPSNVASPSASPRRLPDELDADDAPGELQLDAQQSSSSSLLSPDVYNKLTVNTSSPFLASVKSSGGRGSAAAAAAAAGRAASPSSSPAHSPTSTASQLRPLSGPLMAPLQLSIGISSPAGSMVVASSASGAGLSPRNRSAMPLTLSPRCPQHTSPLRQASSSSAASASASHASSPRRSNPGSGSNSHGVPSPSSARSGRSAGRSPARSPARSPSSFAAPWAKPFWARLQVTIPELNLPISSPVPIGSPVAAGAGLGPRPSPAQAARDREREEREGGGVITTARAPLISPRTAVLTGGDVSASSLLTAPVVPEDGVVSSGPHYAISLLRGRRRHMEDFFLQGTISIDSPEPNSEENEGGEADAAAEDAGAAAAAAGASSSAAVDEDDDVSPAAVPLVNLFGIADGHGKNGALVAQLAAQLLPALFEKNLRQALKAAAPSAAAAASDASAVAATTAASESVAPHKEPSSDFLSPPPQSFVAAASRTPPRIVDSILQSPLAYRAASSAAAVSPLLESSSSPPLTAASNAPLPSLILSPRATSTQQPPSSSAAAAGDVTALVPGSAAAAPPSSASPLNPFSRPPAICAPEDIHDAIDEFRLSDEAAAANPVAHALQSAFLQTDALILAGKATGGSTCTVAYIHAPAEASAEAGSSSSAAGDSSAQQPMLFVGNVGDSRCVLSRGGVALPLSSDHKPCRPDERARIERAGGAVVYVSGWRVDGRLNISRALGDAPLKAPEGIAPALGRVVALPELTCTPLQSCDEFLILASDGVWSKLDNQRAVDIVRKALMSAGGSSGGGGAAAAEEVEEQSMPDRPALDSEQQSYLVPTGTGVQSLNPIATPRPLGPASNPLLGRDGSNDSVLMSDTPHSAAASAMSLLGGLNSKGSMGTTMSAMTNLASPPPAAAAAAGTTATPPMHPATASSLRTRAQQQQQHTPSAGGAASSVGGGFMSPGARSLSSSASFLSPASRDSSTRLTTPTAALMLGKQDSVATEADATRNKQVAGDTTAATAAPSEPAAAAAPALAASTICCWSSLLHRSEAVSAASEALIQYAFDDANSMDNISVAIVLLAPFMRDGPPCNKQATHEYTDMQM